MIHILEDMWEQTILSKIFLWIGKVKKINSVYIGQKFEIKNIGRSVIPWWNTEDKNEHW